MKAIEESSINHVSFLPTSKEIDALINKSNEAKMQMLKKNAGPLLSKLPASWTLPLDDQALASIPATFNPLDTFFAQAPRSPYIHGSIYGSINGHELCMLIDLKIQSMPLVHCFGPLGVYFGPNQIINAFHESRHETSDLLASYLKFRDLHARALFNAYCKAFDRFADVSILRDEGVSGALPVDMHTDYVNVCKMFGLLRQHMETHDVDPDQIGISVVSFCQTWLRAHHDVGNAEFITMSPLFENRHYIYEPDLVADVLKESTCAYLDSYARIVRQFDAYNDRVHGVQTYVRLDDLII